MVECKQQIKYLFICTDAIDGVFVVCIKWSDAFGRVFDIECEIRF